jgi:hypothetical protein
MNSSTRQRLIWEAGRDFLAPPSPRPSPSRRERTVRRGFTRQTRSECLTDDLTSHSPDAVAWRFVFDFQKTTDGCSLPLGEVRVYGSGRHLACRRAGHPPSAVRRRIWSCPADFCLPLAPSTEAQAVLRRTSPARRKWRVVRKAIAIGHLRPGGKMPPSTAAKMAAATHLPSTVNTCWWRGPG